MANMFTVTEVFKKSNIALIWEKIIRLLQCLVEINQFHKPDCCWLSNVSEADQTFSEILPMFVEATNNVFKKT